MSRITVIGTGYVGLVTAACLADLGHVVIGMDVDSAKVERLRKGIIPIYEPGLAELIASCGDRLRFTDDPADAYADGEFIFICVDTPPHTRATPTSPGSGGLSTAFPSPRTKTGC